MTERSRVTMLKGKQPRDEPAVAVVIANVFDHRTPARRLVVHRYSCPVLQIIPEAAARRVELVAVRRDTLAKTVIKRRQRTPELQVELVDDALRVNQKSRQFFVIPFGRIERI